MQNIWAAAVAFDPNLNLVGSFHVTVESFDGTTVRGRFSGSFDSNQVCTPGCVAATDLGTVSGEGTFTIPVTF